MDLYPSQQSAITVVDEANIPRSRIRFSSSSSENWHAILEEAHKRRQVLMLVDTVLHHYEMREDLRAAAEAYRAAYFTAPPSSTRRSSASPDPSAQYDTHKNPSTVLLVTATDIETKALVREFEKELKRKFTRQRVGNKIGHYLGDVGQTRVIHIQTEMGASAAQLTVGASVQALEPTAVIMVGIAFGIDSEKQKIGTILVARQIQDYNLQKFGTSGAEVKIIPRGNRVPTSGRLLNACRSAKLDWKGAEVDFGLILSGDSLVDNKDYRDHLRSTFGSEAIGGEMEGVGLYIAADDQKTDWILVKAICDWADGKKGEGKQQRQQTAARNAARFIFHVLRQLEDEPGRVAPRPRARRPDAEPNRNRSTAKKIKDPPEPVEIIASPAALAVLFPHTVLCGLSAAERKARIGRIEVRNKGPVDTPAGWRGKLELRRPIGGAGITLDDAHVLPTIPAGAVMPIGPISVRLPDDVAVSRDSWWLEFSVVDTSGHEELLFRSSELTLG